MLSNVWLAAATTAGPLLRHSDAPLNWPILSGCCDALLLLTLHMRRNQSADGIASHLIASGLVYCDSRVKEATQVD